MTFDKMYKALVRSHLDYCDIIYHMPSHHNQAPLGVTLNSGRSKLYEELGWESLSDRRMSRRILQIDKISNNRTPPYLNNKLLLQWKCS